MARQAASSTSRPGRQVDLRAQSQGPLGAAHPHRGVPGDRLRQFHRNRPGQPRRHPAVEQTEPIGLLRARLSTGEDQVGRAGRADPATSSWVPPPSGITLTVTSGRPSTAVSSATMRSQDSASSSPPPSETVPQGLHRRRRRRRGAHPDQAAPRRQVPRRGQPRPQRLLSALRAQGERAIALLKTRWKALRHLALDPWRISDITAAALVLTRKLHNCLY